VAARAKPYRDIQLSKSSSPRGSYYAAWGSVIDSVGGVESASAGSGAGLEERGIALRSMFPKSILASKASSG